MPVLRSREIPPLPNPSSSSKTLESGSNLQPSTPSKSVERSTNLVMFSPSPNSDDLVFNSLRFSSPALRRSVRLSSKKNSAQDASGNGSAGTSTDFDGLVDGGSIVNEENKNLKRKLGDVENGGFVETPEFDVLMERRKVRALNVEEGKKNLKMKLQDVENASGVKSIECDVLVEVSSVRDSTLVEDNEETKTNLEDEENDDVILISKRTFTGAMKGKNVMSNEVIDYDSQNLIDLNSETEQEIEESKSKLRFSREEKMKDVVFDHEFDLDINLDNGYDAEKNMNDVVSDDDIILTNNVGIDSDIDLNMEYQYIVNSMRRKHMENTFRKAVRWSASRFARFEDSEEEGNEVNSEVEVEVPQQVVENIEDWPGPFSTALKILRDRERKCNSQVLNKNSVKEDFPLVSWTPREEKRCQNRVAPSLRSLSLSILANNADAITSLEGIPDAIRNQLSQILCDSRQMSPHFLSLLVDGSPSEIRLPDCSWLEESVFEKTFETCNSNSLTVLQLDLGGQCISDSSLRKTLVPKGLNALTTISLKGACRVSDAGLAALVSSAPALRSINLSQCSLLTDVGIDSVAKSVGPVLQELYLDDCDTLDAMCILPILKQLKNLKVLSLNGILGVTDKFIGELIDAIGHNMKELSLANCLNLTDSSMKIIAETCSQLSVLDLSFLGKLTDYSLAHLANGCRRIEELKLSRCMFSDDAISAFLETSGEYLKVLSLNNISKIGQNTTLSLAKCCKNLESLDVSWCRCLTNEALGFIADSCSSLRLLKLFGCTQVNSVFVEGHSNPYLQIIGLKLTPILDHIKRPDSLQGPLHYS